MLAAEHFPVAAPLLELVRVTLLLSLHPTLRLLSFSTFGQHDSLCVNKSSFYMTLMTTLTLLAFSVPPFGVSLSALPIFVSIFTHSPSISYRNKLDGKTQSVSAESRAARELKGSRVPGVVFSSVYQR